jgi:hypothetical protein
MPQVIYSECAFLNDLCYAQDWLPTLWDTQYPALRRQRGSHDLAAAQ